MRLPVTTFTFQSISDNKYTMSSHHFVKEGQEPALFILDAQHHTLLEPLLEWAPLVVVCNSALNEVLMWGIKIDVVTCQADDEVDVRQCISDQEPVQVVTYPSNEKNSMRSTLAYLVNENQRAVNVIADLADHHFQQAESFTQLQIALIDQEIKWTYYPDGKYSKWLPANTSLHIRRSLSSQPIRLQNAAEADRSVKVLDDGLTTIESSAAFWAGEVLS